MRVRRYEPKLYGVHGMDTDRSGLALASGAARFALQCFEDELGPVNGGGIKATIRSIFSIISGKS